MGAKQSKRSVDISGKEAEGGGEVAAAGAGGEGRVEQLADADALKPQLNGDAHIKHEETDKEKELDSGTPENEKDATTEKEGKEEEDKEKEQAPITNGDSEPKVENGESTPTPEDGKKPKKEKVKKKWSLRSISFSRKDKPKQEKKQKEDEPKTNGEPEKVPEETAEAVPEGGANEVAEEVKVTEEKDEKTPETPVTEPLTNGTSTGESSKAETPASEAAAPSPVAAEPAPSPPAEPAPAPEPQPEPEQLPVNGLSLEEPKPDAPEPEKPEVTKPEPPAADTVEIVPAPEIPKEVCERMPLLEPTTPPPLPANPPPSSVASFAATTMAPELTDASLANTADSIAPLTALSDTKELLQSDPVALPVVTELPQTETTSVPKETEETAPEVACESAVNISTPEEKTITTELNDLKLDDVPTKPEIEVEVQVTSEISELPKNPETIVESVVTESSEVVIEAIAAKESDKIADTDLAETITETAAVEIPKEITPPSDVTETVTSELTNAEITEKCDIVETENTKEHLPETEAPSESEPVPKISEVTNVETETVHTEESEAKVDTPTHTFAESIPSETLPEPENIPESEVDISEADDSSLPPPPAQDEDDSAAILEDADDKVAESLKQIPEPIAETEVANGVSEHAALAETNGTPHEEAEAGETPPKQAPGARRAAPLSNGAHHTPQEPLPVSDKLADLIPEVPDVPDLKTETLQETVTDVAVVN